MTRSADGTHTDDGARTLIDQASEGLIGIGPLGEIRTLNEAAVRMLGLSADVVGAPYTRLGESAIVSAIGELLEPGSEHEPTSLRIEKSDRTVAATIAPHECSGARTISVTLRDESEIEALRRRAEAVLASTTDGLIVLGADDVVNFINPAACTMLGLERPAVLGSRKRLWELVAMPAEEGFDPAADGSQVREVPLEEPEHRILDVRTDPVIDDGRYLGYVATLHDVTTEREVMEMKNEFVSTVSHELRTPLTSIKGYIDLILDGDAGEINEITREFLGIVKENSDRLVELINDMLDISRIESGRIVLKVEPLDMAELAAAGADTFAAVAEQTGHRIVLDVPSDLPRAAGDRQRAGQVLINFMSNAIKYSPAGGTVTVSARADDGFVTVSISDEGIGISESDQARLFTKFYRVDSSLTREIGGTGLGLSICKSIIELLGGTVGVRSAAGTGSTFFFTLPVAGPAVVRTPGVEGAGTSGGLILVVDRDPEAAALIETYLTKQGYSVAKAFSADEALRLARELTPRAITLDVMLEDGDGFDLLQQLKDSAETADIPVLVLSIVCDEGRSCRLGASEYLEKPIDKRRLIGIVNSIVGTVASPVVLVVDDDRDIVDVLRRTLLSSGYSVICAYDGAEAMAAIARTRPHLILLDLKMPVMDGYQVIERVKTAEDTKDIPIVVMTAHQIDRARTDILGLAETRVDKPFSVEDLVTRIETFLEHEA
jgi:signal transduction histidine kinase/CheY-like chemotaxis protein